MTAASPASASWDLLDRLRSEPHPVAAYSLPLAAMLILRWADFQEAEAEAMAAFDETDFTPLLPASLHWRRWHELSPEELPGFFRVSLPAAIRRLAPSHEPLAAGLGKLLPAFHAIGELSAGAVAALVAWLEAQPFETPNDRARLLEAFDGILARACSRDVGGFRTPAGINGLLIALAAPAPGERLYDPCFGFAGILTAACQRVQATDKPAFARNGVPALEIAGVEINASAFVVGLARLVLAGVTAPQLELGNALEREGAANPRTDGFDLVVCNPPWNGRIDPRGMDHFPILTQDSTGLFIQHALFQLRPDGRAVIVVPQGFLFQQGRPAALRRWLLDEHRVDAVVSLPEGAFLPYTGVKAAALILRRGGGPTRGVRMVDGTAFFEPRKGKDAATIAPARTEQLAAAILPGNPSESVWDVDATMVADLGFDLSPTRRENTALEQIIEALRREIPIHPLQQLCELAGGRPVPSAGLSETPVGENPIPYIRIGDIQRGQTAKCSSWLTPESASELGPRHRLRAGDVLVSKSGTIGKTGVVRNGAVGGIASGGFFILHPDNSRIDPHFLAAYLQSNDCQEWLKSKSSGSVISGLQKRFIEILPVPLPPLQIQHRVACDVREHQVDAVTQLTLLLARSDSDPVAQWIDRSLVLLAEATTPATSREVLCQIFGSPYEMVREWAMPDNDPPPLMSWALNLNNAADALGNLSEDVKGSASMSVLQQARSYLESAERQIDGHTPIEGKARQLSRQCVRSVDRCIDGLLEDVSISIKPKSNEPLVASRQEVALVVTNEGSLPLWNFTMKCLEWGFETKPFYLPENGRREITVEVNAPSTSGTGLMTVKWQAASIHGRPEIGNVDFAFKIEQEKQPVAFEELGRSPYFHGPPVGPDRADVFFGRETLIANIKAQIQSGNTVLLEGNRRSGKSSILKHLEGKSVMPGWLVVFADFQSVEGDKKAAGMPNQAIWRALARSLASALATLQVPIPLPDGAVLPPGSRLGFYEGCRNGISNETPWEDFAQYFQVILELLGQMDLGLVLMIDEFDKLQEGIDNGVTSPQIPENIRYLIQSYPRFVAILTGSRRMQRLRHEYWSALYGLGNRVGVTALDPQSARKLITEPVNGKVNYTEEAADMISYLTARQPFLIQYLCNRIFELVSHVGIRSVGKKLVEEAAASFVRDNEHFATLWDYAETDRRRFLIDICHRRSAGPDLVTFGFLQQQLTTEGIEISDADLDIDLKSLQELEIIDFTGADGGGIYRLTVPLMGQWIDQQQEYAALRDKARKEQENTR